MNNYDKGDVVRCYGHFTNNLDADIDPTSVFFSVIDPTQAQTNYQYGVGIQIIKDSVGHYHADVDADLEGYYRYRWYSTGTGKAADDAWFVVDPTPF